jgi:hypothetical protein
MDGLCGDWRPLKNGVGFRGSPRKKSERALIKPERKSSPEDWFGERTVARRYETAHAAKQARAGKPEATVSVSVCSASWNWESHRSLGVGAYWGFAKVRKGYRYAKLR